MLVTIYEKHNESEGMGTRKGVQYLYCRRMEQEMWQRMCQSFT